MDWAVYIAASPATPATDEQIEQLAALVADHAGVAGGGAGHPPSLQFCVDDCPLEKVALVALAYWRDVTTQAGIRHADVTKLEITEWDRFDAELEEPNFPDLIGVSELAQLLGVSRQRAHVITGRDDFPKPVERLASGPIWTRPSVQNFLDTWERKTGRPAKVTVPGAVVAAAAGVSLAAIAEAASRSAQSTVSNAVAEAAAIANRGAHATASLASRAEATARRSVSRSAVSGRLAGTEVSHPSPGNTDARRKRAGKTATTKPTK